MTSSQPGSTAPPDTSAFPSSTAISNSQETQQGALDIPPRTSSSVASETLVSSSAGQGASATGSQMSPSLGQQTDTQVQAGTTQGFDALQSSSSSRGAGTPPTATSIAGSSSLVLPAGESTVSNARSEASSLASDVNTATGGPQSLPVTTAGAGSSAVIPPSATTINSNANDETGHLTSGVDTATVGTPPVTTSAGGSVAVVPGETIKTSATANNNQPSFSGEATSGVSAPDTQTGSEGSVNTNTIVNQVVPTTSGIGAGATITHAAEPASSAVAPQSVAVPATGTSLGSETSHVTAGPGETQPTLTPGVGAGPTSQVNGLSGSSVSVAPQVNPVNSESQARGSLRQTTLPDGAVVPNTAQITGAGKGTTAPLETPPASVSSPGTDQISSPNLNVAASVPASVANPSVAAAASKLNTIPASVENPLASVSGNPPLVLNPALTTAASALDALSASIPNPEHQVSLPGSPNSASPVTSGGSNPTGVGPQDTAGVTGSPATTGSPIGATEPAGASGPSVSGIALPVGATESAIGATASLAAGITASPVTGTKSPVDVTGLPIATDSSGDTTAGQSSAPNSQLPATGGLVPESRLTTASNGEVISGTPAATAPSGETLSGPNLQNTATATVSPDTGPTSTFNGQLVSGTPAPNLPPATTESGIVGISTQSNGEVVPISAAASTGSIVSNGQIVPAATGSATTESGIAGISTQSNGEIVPISAAVSTGSIVSNGQIVPAATGSATTESGIVGLSTQSNGEVVPISAAASTGSIVSNGQIVPAATGSATTESGIVGLSTQSNGEVVPISATADTGSTVSNGQVVPAATESARPESGIAGLSTQSNGEAIPISAAAGTSSIISNGQIVPAATVPAATGSATPESGIAGLSTQSNGQVIPISAAAGTGSTVSNGQVVPAATVPAATGSATPESGIAGLSTQSNGQVIPISAAAGTGSTVSNGQIVPAATDHEASAQPPGPSVTGAVAASVAVQSAAAGTTQSNADSPGPTATPPVPPPQQFTGKGPYTQSPVGYDTSTTQVVPTSIIHGPSSTPSATQGHYFGPSSLPSNVPQILYQNGGPGSQPPNTRMVYIAFRYPLNYLFVYNHTVSQQQIFYYIPLGIRYGLEIEASQITMQSLRAWDTYEDVGYVTTLALAWIPEGLVDNLGLLVSTPVSRFYRNPDNSTAFLLSMINNAIPITGANGTDGASTVFGNIPPDTTSAKNAGAPIGGDIGNSEHVRASSVGIGVGVACGAAAYGAAMFFVARRYKKRRQSHMRSPSMFSSPVMSHAGPDAGAGAALMSGAMGERNPSPYYDHDDRAGSRGSGRSGSSRHQISAPVMAENSLGWN